MEKLKRWTKEKSMIFINTADDETPEWARIGKSTVYDLVLNANTVTEDFIEDEMPRDEVDYYKPEMSQELATYEGDKAFDYIWDMFYKLPVGTELNKKILFVFPKNIGLSNETKFQAWNTECAIILNDFNSVDKKIIFTLKINQIERGTVTVTEGKPSFTKAE